MGPIQNNSGISHINIAAKYLDMRIYWKGSGIKEKGFNENGKVIIECSKKYFRPAEVETLLGNPKKARKLLKWKPKITFKKLVSEMVESDFSKLEKLLRFN